jgi:hypothetical protein
MPTVPRYQRGRATTAPLPTLRIDPRGTEAAAAGVDFAPALEQFGRFALAQREKADAIAVNDATARAMMARTEAYDTAAARRGLNALGATADAMSQYQQQLGEIESTLSNDRQRERFRLRAQDNLVGLHEALEVHTRKQLDEADEQTTKALLAGFDDEALKGIGDEARVSGAIKKKAALLQDYGARRGWSDAATRQAVATAVSQTHVDVVTALASRGADLLAEEYAKAHADAIVGSDQPKIDQLVERARTDGEAIRAVDHVWHAMGPTQLRDPVRVASMEQAIRDQYADNPSVIKAAVAELRSRASAHNAEQSEVTAANSAAVLGAYNGGASLRAIMRMPAYLALPGDEAEKIKEHIVDRAYALQERGRAQTSRREDALEQSQFANYWRTSDPENLAQHTEEEILRLQPTLGTRLTNMLMEQKRALGRTAGRQVLEASIDADDFKALADEAGLHPYSRTQTEEQQAALGRLRSAVEVELSALAERTGKRPTREEKRQVMQRVLDTKVMLDTFGADASKPAAMVSADERGAAYVPLAQIPRSTLAKQLNWLRSVGGIRAGTTDAQATEQLQRRLERAYAAQLLGVPDDQIDQILLGRQ